MLHQRFWINDPDVIFVGGAKEVHDPGVRSIPPDPSILDEVRMRLQYQVSTGGFPILGENLKDFTPEKIHLLTLVLPSYGQAARPLDLFLNTTPEVYDLDVKTDWERWHVLLLQNWTDRDKDYNIRFSKLGLDENKTYLVYRFWDQGFLGRFRGETVLRVAAKNGETFAIRETPEHPWVVSTDLHLTQGGVELGDVVYESSSQQLRRLAKRHPGATGHVVIYVPRGYRVAAASGKFREEQLASGERVVHLELNFKEATTPWSLTFEKSS
jgi:hypothetical protein